MVYSNQLQRNTGVVDALVWSDNIADSYFQYMGYSTIKNFFLVRKDISPDITGVALGGQSQYKIPLIADKVGNLQLIFTLNALGNTNPADQPAYVDFVGYAAIESIQLNFSTNDIYTIYPLEHWKKYRQQYDLEQREAASVLVGGDLSITQRRAAALANQTFIVDLNLPFTRGTSRWLELIQFSMEPRIVVKWKKLEDIVESTFPLTLTGGGLGDNPIIKATMIYLDGDERDDNTSRVEKEHGIIRLFDEFKLETQVIPTGTTGQYKLKLNNFKTTAKSCGFIIRPQVALQTPWQDDYFGTLQPVVQWWLEESGGKLIEPIFDIYNRYYMHSQYHRAPPGEYIYEHYFCMTPDDLLNASGSYNFGNTTNLTAVVDFGTVVLSEPMQIDFLVHEYNFNQHVRGDWIKCFK
jgi:hypothetical protein